MDIIICGMDMPEHCGECKLKAVYDDETFCPFFTDNVDYWIAARRRHEDCPLGHVPPHGRLVDADVLRKTLFTGDHCIYSWDEIDDAIDYSTTIIPADKGEIK